MTLPVQLSGPEEEAAPKVIRALLLDDSAFDRARIRRMSRKTDLMLQIDEVGSIGELEAATAAVDYDLILIDYRLPEGDGLLVLDMIHRTPRNSEAATIMITGNGDLKTAVTAMRNGCHDFLTKDGMTAEQLRTAMIGAMDTAQEHRALLAQTAHQREVIQQGLTAALMDERVQGSVVALFRDQMDSALDAQQARIRLFQPAQDHSALDAVLASLDDDDEFIFD
ncbi:response regulator [Sulfitobacter sp. HNIBRBA3233]|uniref:response regulator n=1 Tax=Sulfitobacter marinivivus TaxID=3158558 RepID=UPI0032DFDD3D